MIDIQSSWNRRPVQTNRIPTEGLKLPDRWAPTRGEGGPNQQNPDRGIETWHRESQNKRADQVQTNRIPTEGLKHFQGLLAFPLSSVQTNRIPTEGLKRLPPALAPRLRRVQTNRIPTEGLKLAVM